jgi:hypothetical protein
MRSKKYTVQTVIVVAFAGWGLGCSGNLGAGDTPSSDPAASNNGGAGAPTHIFAQDADPAGAPTNWGATGWDWPLTVRPDNWPKIPIGWDSYGRKVYRYRPFPPANGTSWTQTFIQTDGTKVTVKIMWKNSNWTVTTKQLPLSGTDTAPAPVVWSDDGDYDVDGSQLGQTSSQNFSTVVNVGN